jgi:hypothetical protein
MQTDREIDRQEGRKNIRAVRETDGQKDRQADV